VRPLRTIFICAGLLASALQTTVRGQGESVSVPLSTYVARLDQLAEAVRRLDEKHPEGAPPIVARIPPAWHVVDGARGFDVPADALRRSLTKWRAAPDAASRTALVDELAAMRAEAVAFEQPASGSAAARTTLTDILARREFRGIGGPGAWDRFRQRVLEWLLALLARLVGSSRIPTVTSVLVYVLIALAAFAVAVWLYRSLRRNVAEEQVTPDRTAPAAESWNTWLAAARTAAAEGRWRDAVHLAYWCGIAFLEAEGAWKTDSSRTPREYVRLLAPGSARVAPLTALTRSFEHVWYGAAGAERATYDDALAELRKLGCPSA